MQIGFIGRGWIGRHYADDFETRGYKVVRYALEQEYVNNKVALHDCAIVFIAVPTPTTPTGFFYSAVEDALTNLAPGTIAVIKSTLLPGTTRKLQAKFPELIVMHSPEFLVEKTAAYDAAHPARNLIGVTEKTALAIEAAETVLSLLPPAPYKAILFAEEAELVKYAGNCFLMTKVLFMNLFHDYTMAHGANWESVRSALVADTRIGASHTNPIHQAGRGAGGHCFIKDFEAWRQDFKSHLPDDANGLAVIEAIIVKNIELLTVSEKDIDLLQGVYGELAV